MPLCILLEQTTCEIEVCMVPDAGENIEHLSSSGLRVKHAIGGKQRQMPGFSEINQCLVQPFFTTQAMALDFDKNIFSAKCAREVLQNICGIAGNF